MLLFRNHTILEPAPPIHGETLTGVSQTLHSDYGIRYIVSMEQNGFTMTPKHAISFQRNSFWPIVHGHVITSGDACRLEIWGHAVSFVRIFLTIYMAFALFFVLVCLTLLVRNQLASIVPLFISTILCLSGYGLTHIMTRWCFRKIVRAFEQSK